MLSGPNVSPNMPFIIYVEHTPPYQSFVISHMPRLRTWHEKCSLGEGGSSLSGVLIGATDPNLNPLLSGGMWK